MLKMKIALALVAACLASPAFAAEGDFTYGANGLDWDGVAEECGTGQSQSPIDVVTASAVPLGDQSGSRGRTFFNFNPGTNMSIENTGHGLNAMFDVNDFDAYIETDDGPQSLKPLQFHWHSPSEHTIDGVLFPLEVHLVTQTNVTGDLAVIGVMYKYGEENPLLEKIWPTESAGFPFRSRGMEGETPDYMHEKGAKANLGVPIDVMSEILPEDHTYYAYRGSLTTPPCSEGVYWHLLKEPVTASVDQVINFQNVLAETSEGIRTNNRSPQPINGREVVMVAEK